MVDNIRDTIIQQGIQGGYKVSTINKVLRDNNQAEYNPLTYGKNYLDIPKNLGRNAGEFARDARTISGMIVSPLMEVSKAPKGQRAKALQDKFINAIYSEPMRKTFTGMAIGAGTGSVIPGIGTIPGAIAGSVTGLVGGPKNLANAVLSTYNTNVDNVLGLRTDLRDVAQGAFNNPLYSGIDILSVGGAKAIGAGAKKLTRGLPDNSPQFLRQLLPNEEQRKFNRALTEAKVASRAQSQDIFKAYRTLDTMPNANRLELVKEITMGNGNLSKEERAVANALKVDLRAAEKQAIDLGILDKNLSRNNTIAQYVMAKLLDKLPTVLYDDVVNYIQTGSTSERLAKELASSKTNKLIDKIISDGAKKYDEGKIAFLTQKLATSQDPIGEVVAREINKTGEGYFGRKRIIGRTRPEDLARVLDKSINYQLEEVAKSKEVIDVINEVLNKPGVGKLITEDLKELPKGYKAISKEALNKSIAEAMNNGDRIDIVKAIKDAQTKAKGSYLVKDLYLDAIKNSFTPSSLGRLKSISSSFKKAVLANPHWIVLNRIGNLVNNSIGGVSLKDYADTKKYRDIIPKQLLQQTSFNSYIGKSLEEGVQMPYVSSMKSPYNKLLRGFDEFKGSNKSLDDIGKLASIFYTSTSDITANPLFRLEATLERQDRFANFIHQAKMEANATGKDVKDIIKEANTNNELFNKLNTEVNKDLGDYLGRNYAIPSGYYDVLGELVPFYRFLTQTGRTSLHQMANHPFAYELAIGIPPRTGSDISEEIINEYKLDRDKYKGGVPYKYLIDEKGQKAGVRTVGIEPLPAQTVAENLSSMREVPSLVSPIFTTLGDILRYKKDGDRTPSSPRLTATKLGIIPGDVDNYKPTIGEMASYGLNQGLLTTYNPYRLFGMYTPEIIASVMNKGIQSKYDTNVFRENPLSYVRETPSEQIGKWLSIQAQSNYTKRGKSKRRAKQEAAAKTRTAKIIKRNMELKK